MKKIVIAEDDVLLLKFYIKKLEQQGYELISFKSGAGVFDEVKTEKPDLIILDLIMPEKDGFDVLEELNQNAETKKIKTIIISNLGQDSDVKKVIQLGANRHIFKGDFSLADIPEIIAKES